MFLVTCFQGFSDNKSAIFILRHLQDGITQPAFSPLCGKDGSEADSITVQKTKQTQDAISPSGLDKTVQVQSFRRENLPLGTLLNGVEKQCFTLCY